MDRLKPPSFVQPDYAVFTETETALIGGSGATFDPVVLRWRVLASVPRLAATAVLASVIGALR
jgi:hypothetical protein